MDLDSAIFLLKKAVKNAGNVDQKHIDLTLVSAEERPELEKALVFSQLAVAEGKLTKEELYRKLGLN